MNSKKEQVIDAYFNKGMSLNKIISSGPKLDDWVRRHFKLTNDS